MSDMVTAKAINSTLGTANFKSLDTTITEQLTPIGVDVYSLLDFAQKTFSWRYALPEGNYGRYKIAGGAFSDGEVWRVSFEATLDGELVVEVVVPYDEGGNTPSGEVATVYVGDRLIGNLVISGFDNPQEIQIKVRKGDTIVIHRTADKNIQYGLYSDVVLCPPRVIGEEVFD